MTIPESILKLSNKELDTLLTTDKYKAKYFRSSDSVLEIVHTVKNTLFYKVIGASEYGIQSTGKVSFLETMPRLNKSDIVKGKKENIKSYFYKWNEVTVKKYLTSVLSNIMSKEYFDITVSNEAYNIIIHYPEIIIRNSVEQEHLMRDVYIKFGFSIENFKLLSIALARTTYTLDEYEKAYIFSHLNNSRSDTTKYNTNFCYGSSVVAATIQDMGRKSNYSNLSAFILLFREYLGWESLEGVPYTKLDTIGRSDIFELAARYYSSTDIVYEEAMDKVLLYVNSLEYSFELIYNVYHLVLSDSTVDLIENILTEGLSENYYLHKNLSCNVIDVENYLQEFESEVVFKNVKQTTRVIREQPDLSKYVKRVHRNLLQLVVDNITEQLEEFIFNKLENNE